MDSSSISEKIEEKGPSFKWGRKKEKENNSRRPRSNFAPCLAAISLPGKHSSPRQREHSPPPPPLPTPLPLELANNEDNSINVSSTPSSVRHHRHHNYSSSSSLIKSKDGGESSQRSYFKKFRRSSSNKTSAVAAEVSNDCLANLPSFHHHRDSSFKSKGESSRHFFRHPGDSHDESRRNKKSVVADDLNPREYNRDEGYNSMRSINQGKSNIEKEKKELKKGETINVVGIKRSKILTRIPCKKTKPSTEEENPSTERTPIWDKKPNHEKKKHVEKKPVAVKTAGEKKPVEKKPAQGKKIEEQKLVEEKQLVGKKPVEKEPMEEKMAEVYKLVKVKPAKKELIEEKKSTEEEKLPEGQKPLEENTTTEEKPMENKPAEESNPLEKKTTEGEADKKNESDVISEEINDQGPKTTEEARVFNLGLGKPTNKSLKEIILERVRSTATNTNNKPPTGEANMNEKKPRKVKLSLDVSLTKQEIEEDFFSFMGGKPPRRPQKRPKNVQKQLDLQFPGLHLTGISTDSYK